MNKQTEALKMAIEAIEYNLEWYNIGDEGIDKSEQAIQACKEALEQEAQEPVAFDKLTNDEKASIKRQINNAFNEGFEKGKAMSLVASIPLNLIKLESQSDTHPAPSWQGLSDDEIKSFGKDFFDIDICLTGNLMNFARAIEQALKEKNGG